MSVSVFICKFIITPTQSNDTGSEKGRQPTASSHRQHALTLTATGVMVYIQNFDSPSFTNIPSNTSAARCPAFLLDKRGIFFLSSWSLRGVTPKGQNSPGHKGQGCCNRRTPWLTSKRWPSWDCISLHPLFLSPAAILGERLSCSHVLITEMW